MQFKLYIELSSKLTDWLRTISNCAHLYNRAIKIQQKTYSTSAVHKNLVNVPINIEFPYSFHNLFFSKSHSTFSNNFADFEFKRKVPVSIYRYIWRTMEHKTKLMHFSFIVVKTRFAKSVTFAQTSINFKYFFY